MWILLPDGDEPALARLDPETDQEIARVVLPGRVCQAFAIAEDAVWACTPGGAVRIDPETNLVVSSVEYPIAQWFGRMVFGAGFVWGLGTSNSVFTDVLVRIDPDGETVDLISLGHRGGAVAFGFDAIWVTAPDDGLLLRVDPTTGEVTEAATGLVGPGAVAIGPDAVWLTLHAALDDEPASGDATVIRIDPSDGAVVAEIVTDAPAGDGDILVTDQAVWVRAPDAFLTRIDPATNEVVETLSGPASSGSLGAAFGSLWVTAVERQTVWRLEP